MKSFGMPAVWKKHFPFFSITSICASLLLPLCIYSNRLWGFCATALLVGISAILFLIDLYQACKYWKEDHEDWKKKEYEKLLGIVLSTCLIMVTFIPFQIKAENTADNILIEHGVPLEIINKMTELQKEYLRDNLTVYFQWIW